MRPFLAFLLALALTPLAQADGPSDNRADQVRRIPRAGIAVPEADRAELEQGLASLRAKLDRLSMSEAPQAEALRPDVEIFDKAVHDALTYGEFFAPAEIGKARALLAEGHRARRSAPRRLRPLDHADRAGRPRLSSRDRRLGPALRPGRPRLLLHRGSGRTTGSTSGSTAAARRSARSTSSTTGSHSPGTFTPGDTIVLHPYGRYCNAFKFAGEIGRFEALDSVRDRYRIDDDRIAVRGFSMGGAAAWHFAVHYADRWFAANPGAGFSETPLFLDVFQKETLEPTWYERKLWHLYDCTDWAVNLRQCPTVAYSGDLDNQKQAADVMAEAMREARRSASPTSSARAPGTPTTPTPPPRSPAGSTASPNAAGCDSPTGSASPPTRSATTG